MMLGNYMNILFVCKHNRFRSKVAEAYFNKINKSDKVKARSAGLISNISISEHLFVIYKRANFKVTEVPEKVNEEVLNWADKIVIVADDVEVDQFKKSGKGVIVWNIKDVPENDELSVGRRIGEICVKVRDLVKELA